MQKKPKSQLAKLAIAAKAALLLPKNSEISQWIGTGPSIRARARLAMLVAFLVAAPTLMIGVMRSDDVSKFANTLAAYDRFWESIGIAQLAVEETRSALWSVEAQPEIENKRDLSVAVDDMHRKIESMILARPSDYVSNKMNQNQLDQLTSIVLNRVEEALEQTDSADSMIRSSALSLARLQIKSLAYDLKQLEQNIAEIVKKRRSRAISAMSMISRDQLILFLILLFSIPIFVIFVPGWIVSPLIRLKNIEHRIEEGRIRELAVSGNDEVSQLARAIKDALMWREELDVRKSTKIFEIRNVLRAVIARVNEPVLIIDRTGRINYANHPASELLRIETHYLEGSGLADHFYSTDLTKAVAAGLSGDIHETGIKTRLEFKDGRAVSVLARLSAVHDRAGTVSRVVIVLIPETEPIA